ncbi:MAG: ABC transporter permease [Bryobacteraceae bacterium]|jgi:putative ABC transport system permease protein
MPGIWMRIKELVGRSRLDGELDEEVGLHLQMMEEEFRRRGMSEAEARAAARREFGGVAHAKEAYRDQRGFPWLESFAKDVRYALRGLRRSPGFTAAAVLSLALGIGANTAVFSIIDTILLRPLPYRNPSQLVRLYETESAPGSYPFAEPDFVDWKAQNSTFQDMTMFGWPHDMNLSASGRPEHVLALPTEANFFSLLGVKPLLGRTWAAGEDQPGKDDVAILGYGLWQSHFAGDPHAVGRSIELNARKYTIVGVMPASFHLPFDPQLWVPQVMDSKLFGGRGTHWASAIGRMKPGVTMKAALEDLKVIAARLEKQYPSTNGKVGAVVTSLRDDMVGDSSGTLFLMLGAVGLVLLIACANVANLLLSRALARQKEVALRSALGASRVRLARQLLTESLLLSLAGGALGLLLAWGGVSAFSSAKSFDLPRFNAVQLNGAVIGFTFALALATGVLFGMFPALQMSRLNALDELKGGAGSSVSPGRRRRFISHALVAAEIALSAVLLISAGLLLKDFAALRGLDIGVRRKGVWTAAVQLPEANYKTDMQVYGFSEALLEGLRRIGGVDSVALSDHLPLEGGSNGTIKLRGQTGEASNQLVESHAVSPEYFRAMGIRLLQGRVFTQADVQTAFEYDLRLDPLYAAGTTPPAGVTNGVVYPCVINESMARFFWPNQNPLGKVYSHGNDNGPWTQVIGVVSDVRQTSLTERPAPEAYAPFDGASRLFLILHTSLPPSGVTAQVRHVLGQIDASLPLYGVRSMDEVAAGLSEGQQYLSLLVGSFAGLAALLAAIGIYGVLAYAVRQRTREIGIRMSFGASRGHVLGEVLWEGMRLALLGLAAGIAGAFAAGRILESLLHEVKPDDPAIFAATAGLLAGVALVACCLPARRAARLDPLAALRYE